MKVLLCGYHWAGCRALEILLDRGYEVDVFTHEAPSHIPCLVELSQKRGIKARVGKLSREHLAVNPELLCSIYYRDRIPKTIFGSCAVGAFNLHPSLLPQYRGCSSLTWAMVNGETEVGFSYHYLKEEFDTGNLILQRGVRVEEFDTQATLYNRVMFEALKVFEVALDRVKMGYPGVPQVGGGDYYGRGAPYQGKINPSWPEEKIERFIRAMTNPPLPVATLLGKPISSKRDLSGFE